MDKFENQVIVYKSGCSSNDVVTKLNKLGLEGWELCGMLKNSSENILFFLKRKISIKKVKKNS